MIYEIILRLNYLIYFIFFRVVGLCHSSSEANSAGYIVLMKKRSANAAFFRWHIKEVLVPYILDIRSVHELQSDSMMAFVSTDMVNKRVLRQAWRRTILTC